MNEVRYLVIMWKPQVEFIFIFSVSFVVLNNSIATQTITDKAVEVKVAAASSPHHHELLMSTTALTTSSIFDNISISSYSQDFINTYDSQYLNWYSSDTQRSTFDDFHRLGTSYFSITGTPRNGSRGLESTFWISGNITMRLSFYVHDHCPNPTILFFPAGVTSYFFMGNHSYRIQLTLYSTSERSAV